ncbi:MAG: Smr/MutS family protein [Bacteroidetes bacterium]|nr:Smr/MutS family protein [Bacteroidota bacterium]
MKFSIGDKIILKQSGEEGVVTAYINEQMIEVEVSGITFPVYIDDIDHPYLKWFTEKKKTVSKSQPEQLPVEKHQFKTPKLAKGVYFSFLPEYKADVFEDEVKDLKVYLLNELPTTIYFNYKLLNNQQEILFSHEGKLHKFSHIYLHSIPFDVMNEQPRFHWELSDSNDVAATMQTGVLRIKPQKLFEHIHQLLLSNEPTFSYLLIDGFTPAPKKVQDDFFVEVKPKDKSKTKNKDWRTSLPHFEIDLHLEKIADNVRGMSNADKLQLQLQTLHKHLDTVIANRQERTVIIHGLGKGVLKDEVHKILREIPEVTRFSNEWLGQYGFGATEVWFKY